MRHLVPLMARPDGRGEPWIIMPPTPEGARYLRVGSGLDVLSRLLSEVSPQDEFDYLVDFSLVEATQRQLGKLGEDRRLSIYDFDHPVWVHQPGTYCSNCMVELLEGPEIEPEDENALDDQVTPHPDACYPEELSEDLRDNPPDVLIEQHADCATCGRDFILSKHQAWEWSVGIDEKPLCTECMNQIR